MKTQKELALSLSAGCLAGLFAVLATNDLPTMALVFVAITALSLSLFKLYPSYRQKKRAKRLEKHLPFALMQLSIDLSLGKAFEKALEGLGKGNFQELSREFRQACREIEMAGASVQEALLHLGERSHSLEVKRCLAQMTALYEQGGEKGVGGEGLRRLAREQLLKQKSELKEFSGKQVMASLLFISVAAIAPALFQAFVVIGSLFLEVSFQPWEVILVSCLGFPLANLGIILLVREKTPECLK